MWANPDSPSYVQLDWYRQSDITSLHGEFGQRHYNATFSPITSFEFTYFKGSILQTTIQAKTMQLYMTTLLK